MFNTTNCQSFNFLQIIYYALSIIYILLLHVLHLGTSFSPMRGLKGPSSLPQYLLICKKQWGKTTSRNVDNYFQECKNVTITARLITNLNCEDGKIAKVKIVKII